jgi:uncharacterized phage-associated protein
MSGPHDARAIANEFLRLANRNAIHLTPMQIIKLVYIANGWSLALLNRPLIKDPIQAWQYGPVIPSLYNAFNRWGSGPIIDPAVDETSGLEYTAKLDDEERRLIVSVFTSYGHLHAFQLSNKMHEDGTPWTKIFTTRGAYSVIPPEMIRQHFLELTKQNDGRL